MVEKMMFSHSGSLGDVIYSLPFCINLSNGRRFSMNLQTGVPATYVGVHPAGNVRMDKEGASMIAPLIQEQKYVESVQISGCVPPGSFVLDRFRDGNILNLSAGSIAQWYNMLDNRSMKRPDLSNRWIEVNDDDFSIGRYKIVMFRSLRYRRRNLNYQVMKKFSSKILFIGLPEEHRDFCDTFFKVDYYKISNFLEAAKIMKSAKFVIGNQTGLFSVAEGMKVPRILETSFECPNVVMDGGCYQYAVHTNQFYETFMTFYENLCGGSSVK